MPGVVVPVINTWLTEKVPVNTFSLNIRQAALGANPQNFIRKISQPKKFRIYFFSTDDNPLCTLTYNTGYLFVTISSTCPGRPQPQTESLKVLFSL